MNRNTFSIIKKTVLLVLLLLFIILSGCKLYMENKGSSWDIVFTCRRSSHTLIDPFDGGKNYELYVMKKDGSNITRLTYSEKQSIGIHVNCFFPSCSADKRMILLSRMAQSNGGGGKRDTIINSDGTNEYFFQNKNNYTGTWRRNSFGIISSRYEGAHFRLYRFDYGFTNEERIRTSSDSHLYPTCHPNGVIIVFIRITNRELYQMNIDGSGFGAVAGVQGSNCGSPSFSPDGEYLLYSYGSHIYYIKYPGGSPVQLTSTGTNGYPVWNPRGDKIYFMSIRSPHSSNGEIYSINFDGTGLKRVTYISDQDPDANCKSLCYRGVPR